MARRKVFLSVDFDYFAREEDEWDWGHAEYTDLAWFTRVRHFEETSLERHATPHPRDFWTKLVEAGFSFDDCGTFSVADSHLWAAPDFLDLAPGQVEIVNFDAHHDMGYKPWKELKQEWLDKGRVDCSNWLLGLLYAQPNLTASVVYPPWKGTREVDEGGPPSWKNKALKGRFSYGVYSEELLKKLAGDVVGIFIAKSSAWMPPWHDQAFVDFVEDGASTFDLIAEMPYESQERRNPMTVREFNLEAALDHNRQFQELSKKMVEEYHAKKAAGA
jgi:hypothetical protein